MSSNLLHEASHVESWYVADGNFLNRQLSAWLEQVTNNTNDQSNVRAIIAPHAGYNYNEPTAAYLFKYIDPTNNNRIFLLGPSQHYSLV